MSVPAHLVLYARRVTGDGRTIAYFDLACCPGTPATHGIFNPIGGGWREVFTEAEALARLRSWVHEDPSATKRPRSQITSAGRCWLASVT